MGSFKKYVLEGTEGAASYKPGHTAGTVGESK
jgi:hypothetical protein